MNFFLKALLAFGPPGGSQTRTAMAQVKISDLRGRSGGVPPGVSSGLVRRGVRRHGGSRESGCAGCSFVSTFNVFRYSMLYLG